MKKYIYIAITILLSAGVLFGVYAFVVYQTNKPTLDPQTKRGVISTDKKINFKTNGQVIKMNDFYEYPVRKVDQDAVYISDQLNYGVMYWPQEDKFRLPVMAQPIKENSLQAEAELLSLLDITKQDACKLNVVITGHYSVDPQFEQSAEYNLSFCPGNHIR